MRVWEYGSMGVGRCIRELSKEVFGKMNSR